MWILIWGGQLDLAQALWKIQNTMPEDKAQNLIAAARVYAIADQYDECGPWIRSNFKDLFYIVNQVSFRGMYRGGDSTLVSKDWVDKNIKSNPAPLAQLYPNYKGGDPWGKVTGIKEGDSPSVLYLLNGNPEKPMSGCWGGTFSLIEGTNHYTDGKKSDFPLHTESVYKWRSDFQSDFLKRLAWLNK